MNVRDRVKEFRRVRAADLRPHPKNWRSHPALQQDALRGLLADVGFAGALLVRELEDGSLQLIDGHLRAETLPDAQLPVLVLDVNEQEADKLLAFVDPLAGLAEPNADALAQLLREIDSTQPAVMKLLEQLQNEMSEAARLDTASAAGTDVAIPESYQVVVDCADETQQRTLYERLTQEGHRCHVLTL